MFYHHRCKWIAIQYSILSNNRLAVCVYYSNREIQYYYIGCLEHPTTIMRRSMIQKDRNTRDHLILCAVENWEPKHEVCIAHPRLKSHTPYKYIMTLHTLIGS